MQLNDKPQIEQIQEQINQYHPFVSQLTAGLGHTIVGQEHLVQSLIIGLLADGHILLEGVPGLAKTLAIKTLAQLIDAKFSRIQFTPDLLPADLTGTLIYSRNSEKFIVKEGPLFAHFVLADEINRAPAKVQSALLEAMQERQVTIGDETHKLPYPFLVMATQNPIEQEGTYPLPEAQTDRFMLKVTIDYPSIEEEQQIILQNLYAQQQKVTPVVSLQDIAQVRKVVKRIYIDPKILHYITQIVFSSRFPSQYGLPQLEPMISFGGSPRASINMALAAQALAFINKRAYVIPEDVRAVCQDVMQHRLGLSYEAEANDLTATQVIEQILNQVQIP